MKPAFRSRVLSPGLFYVFVLEFLSSSTAKLLSIKRIKKGV